MLMSSKQDDCAEEPRRGLSPRVLLPREAVWAVTQGVSARAL